MDSSIMPRLASAEGLQATSVFAHKRKGGEDEGSTLRCHWLPSRTRVREGASSHQAVHDELFGLILPVLTVQLCSCQKRHPEVDRYSVLLRGVSPLILTSRSRGAIPAFARVRSNASHTR